MCSRFVLLKEHFRQILRQLGIGDPAEFGPRYNIAPASLLPAVRAGAAGEGREVAWLRWGLVPAWSKGDGGTMLVNARAETVATKPSFRDALRRRRCLIPASGFYEWETVGRLKLPWLFRLRDEQPFVFAGLWESWRAPGGEPLETFAIVTTEPNDLMRPIHDRFPVILTGGQCDAWLDPAVKEAEQLVPLLRAIPGETMTKMAVSRYMSNVRHEGPECLAPAPAGGDGEQPDSGPQLSLGLG